MNQFLREVARRILFPGFDIHTRARTTLCSFWGSGTRRVLDAGCGNGYFSYLAWKTGANVDAVSFEEHSIGKANQFFRKQIVTERLHFIYKNLYDLEYPDNTFDEIICYETIEHLMRDQEMVNCFGRWLKPGGTLHLCAPNKHHSYNANITPSPIEDGWHVRHGYDQDSYKEILAQASLSVGKFAGVGGRIVCACDDLVRFVNRRFGLVAAAPVFLITWPFWPLFCRTNPESGLSIYVQAVKNGQRETLPIAQVQS